MKKFILSLMLICAGSLMAAPLSTNLTATSRVNILPGGGTVSQIAITAPAGNSLSLAIFDAPGVANTNVLAAYSYNSYSVVNVTNTYTNFFGVLNSNVFQTVLVTSNNVAASTNLYPILFQATVNTNTTAVFDFAGTFNSGMLVTNSAAAAVINLTYTK